MKKNKLILFSLLLIGLFIIVIYTYKGNIPKSYQIKREMVDDSLKIESIGKVIKDTMYEKTVEYSYNAYQEIKISNDAKLVIGGDKEGNVIFYRTNDSIMVYSIAIEDDVLKGSYERKRMVFDGYFSFAFSHITYTCYHIPKIFVFSYNGEFIGEIDTEDRVPYPSIIRYKSFLLYERGKTFNSNMGAFCRQGLVYVLSYRVPINTKSFIVDKYSLSGNRYINSFEIPIMNGDNNRGISLVFGEEDMLYIKTSNYLYQLRW